MDILISNLPAILTLILGIAVIWSRISKVLVVLKETQEFLGVAAAALSDQRLSQDELDAMAKEARDVYVALKQLLKK
jgi:hypothetical protein